VGGCDEHAGARQDQDDGLDRACHRRDWRGRVGLDRGLGVGAQSAHLSVTKGFLIAPTRHDAARLRSHPSLASARPHDDGHGG